MLGATNPKITFNETNIFESCEKLISRGHIQIRAFLNSFWFRPIEDFKSNVDMLRELHGQITLCNDDVIEAPELRPVLPSSSCADWDWVTK